MKLFRVRAFSEKETNFEEAFRKSSFDWGAHSIVCRHQHNRDKGRFWELLQYLGQTNKSKKGYTRFSVGNEVVGGIGEAKQRRIIMCIRIACFQSSIYQTVVINSQINRAGYTCSRFLAFIDKNYLYKVHPFSRSLYGTKQEYLIYSLILCKTIVGMRGLYPEIGRIRFCCQGHRMINLVYIDDYAAMKVRFMSI